MNLPSALSPLTSDLASAAATASAGAATGATVSADLAPVAGLSVHSLCASACLVSWRHDGGADGFALERAADFGEDRAWHDIGRIPGSARSHESIGLLGGGGRAWRHRLRALAGDRADERASAWSEAPPVVLPDAPGGPRGRLIVAPSAAAPRNISGSFIEQQDGTLLFAYTASANLEDNAPSWIAAIALDRAGRWQERGVLFPSREDWTCVSRPSFVRMSAGGILATYSIGRAKVAAAHDGAPAHFIHRTVARISGDDGRTWSEERVISDDLCDYEMGNSNGTRNLRLGSGRLLTNVHVCKPPALAAFDPLRGDLFNEVMGTYLLLSDDQARTWQRVPADPQRFFFTPDDPYGRKRIGFWEIAVVEYAPDRLLMYARTASGWLYECRSRDGGQTWSEPRRSSVPYPIAPPNLTRIPGTSTIVLLSNPHVNYLSSFDGGKRSVLAVQCSDDGGETWHGYRELEYDGDGGEGFWSLYSYPDFIWSGEVLHVIYSRRFEGLYHQALTKDWLLGR